jgi:hypothetical protein
MTVKMASTENGTVVEFTLEEFQIAYNQAIAMGVSEFTFKGQVFDLDYAKQLYRYLRGQIRPIGVILEKYGIEAQNNIIDLGWENGWGQKTLNLKEELRRFWIEGTYNRSGSASWQKMTVRLKSEDEEYEMRWNLDSGD